MRKTFLARRCMAVLLTLALVISLAPAVLAADPAPIPLKISTDRSSLEMTAGETISLPVSVTKDDDSAFGVNVRINCQSRSTQEDIVVVTDGNATLNIQSGQFYGRYTIKLTAAEIEKEETAKIWLYASGDNGCTDTKQQISITVKPRTASKATITPPADFRNPLKIGESVDLTAELDIITAGTTWNWSITKGDSVTITENGDESCTVKAVKAGATTIKATSTSTSTSLGLSDTYEIEVAEPGLTFSPSTFSLKIGEEKTVTATANNLPDNGSWMIDYSDGDVSFTQKNLNGTSSELTVKGVKATSAPLTIPVRYKYGSSSVERGKFEVTVLPPELTVECDTEGVLSGNSINLTQYQEVELEASTDVDFVGGGSWSWTLDNTSYVSIAPNNTETTTITANSEGTGSKLKVKYTSTKDSNNYVEKEFTVNVTEFKPPTVSINPTAITIKGGTEATVKATLDQNLSGTWAWVIDSVAGITYSGNNTDTLTITADPDVGSATLHVSAKYTISSEVYESPQCRVTVEEADRVIALDPTTLSFNILKDGVKPVDVSIMKGGDKLSVDAGIIYDETLKDVQGRTIAKVTGGKTVSDGKLTLFVEPVGTGKATLEVIHEYGEKIINGEPVKQVIRDKCEITVEGPSINIDPPLLELDTYDKPTGYLTASLENSADLSKVKWEIKSGNKFIDITYDQRGHCKVTALKDGDAVIRASYELKTDTVSGTIYAECKVKVGTYSMTINPEGEVRKEPGESTTISATVKKIGMGNVTVPNHEKNLSWQISDGTIARFDTANGPLQKSGTSKVKVVGIPGKTGTVQVTARWAYNGHSAEETLTIVFGAPEPESLNFTVSPSSLTLESGTEGRLTASGATIQWKDNKSRPAPSDFKASYTWKSSDPKVAAVDKDGKVTAVSAGEAEITATARATVNGVEITGERTVKVKVTVSTRVKSITITKPSNGSISMEAGTREAVTVVVDPEGTPYAWTSSDEAVARVEGGSIVAVKPGKATLTVTAGGLSATLEVTVNGLDQLQSEITVIEGKSVDVGELFKAYGAAEGKTPVYSPQDPNIASYNSGRIMGNSVGETTITASVGTYRISFKVTVVADATSTITLPTLYTQTQKTLPFRDFLDRFRQQADGALDHIMGLSVDPAKGTLYYNYSANGESGSGVGAGNYYLSPGVGQRGISEITFVPRTNYSGQVVINYTVVTKDNKNLACRIIFDVDPGDGSSAGLFLKTDYNTPLRFNGDDFNRVCRERLGAQLDYVTFSQPSERVGALYTDYVSSGNYGSVVDPRTHYSRSALNNVWFVPAPGFSGSATVYYTAYAVGGGSFAGQMDITVGVEDGVTISGLTYDISRGGVARFDDADFNRYCRQVLDFGQTVSYVRFDRLPAESEGILWYDYTSSSNTGERASTGTSYYYGTRSPRIDWLTFVPASGFTGTVKIPFTGWTTDGGRFTGTVEVNVRGGSTAGDILYICRAGETVRFDDTDFNGLSRDVTGSSLNYIQFTNLPGGSSGAVYYNNSRASTSTRYRNGSSTPRIDNLSFRASSSFAGAVDIPFEGRSTNGETFYGVVTVATSADAVGGGGSTGASQSVFTDMAGYSDAQKAAVNYLYDHNITRGMTTTQFGPQNSIRRGDFARMLYQAFDLAPTASTKVFTDVPANAYYAQAVNALHSRGIVSGIGGGLFAPNDTLTRQDAICMVQRAMRSVGWSADDGPASALYRYSDGGSVAGYAQGAMSFAVQRGILPTGGSWLNPTQPLTRVDMAEIIYRVLAG